MNTPLLIFDINGTLLKRPKKTMPTIENIKFRPYLDRLITYLHNHKLDYAFWTNAHRPAANSLFNLLKNYGFNKPTGCYDFYSCRFINDKLVKDLSIFKRDAILIDDSPEKVVQKDKYIRVESFKADDKEILNLIEKLHKLVGCSCDISDLLVGKNDLLV